MTARAVFTATFLCLLAGCTSAKGGANLASKDPEVQGRYQTAQRTLEEIKEWKARGKDVYPECKTIQMLFLKELKEHESAEGRTLAEEIIKTCQDIKPTGR